MKMPAAWEGRMDDTTLPSQPPINRELTRCKMRLNRLLGPHVQIEDEELMDEEFVRAVVGRFLSGHQQ